MPNITTADITTLRSAACPTDFPHLVDLIRASGSLRPGITFEHLEAAIAQTESFFEELLPFILEEARRADDILPDIPLLDGPGEVRLSQRQCLCILANAFLCRFTDRVSRNCRSDPDMPSINFDEMFGGRRFGPALTAKWRMVFRYFETCRQRVRAGDALERPVRFFRHQAGRALEEHWRASGEPLIPPVMHGLGESIDDAKDMLRVDFANAIVGGAAVAYGCVQEEIMFCLCPELIVSRLFCPAMKEDEAIAFVGTEQFSLARGYAGGLKYGGPCLDASATADDGILHSWIVAIDALAYGRWDEIEQYSAESVCRELGKAWAGFTIPGSPVALATGNWGCGAFGGDAELKSIIQWVAASRAGKVMHYFPWDNVRVHGEFPALAAALVEQGVTVGQLSNWLFDEMRDEGVFEQVREWAAAGSGREA